MPAGLKLDGSVGEGKNKRGRSGHNRTAYPQYYIITPPLVDLTLDPWFVERRLVGRARNRSSPDDEEDEEEEEEEEEEEAKKKLKSGGWTILGMARRRSKEEEVDVQYLDFGTPPLEG
ncbi:hypothetical protein TEQG_05625 [Trichophyton equinum CBS 127.97]|uniref:Uncharacterized protein n=1 Tax=Trichophyton equinum (strain ATCC MYA-4606 / CBS 127.97) TaxID=559882 RepID=F2PXK9_TRIEC|nr:hypothetical protein TEQG_05625 [Trichophyton equinum CBS 127.97]